ncbi:unnamed protein product [Ectocarpus sp. CCAP 1310/34]|nr:unnamed protein product [Ectocarpus sp. CCAP 1310/34]
MERRGAAGRCWLHLSLAGHLSRSDSAGRSWVAYTYIYTYDVGAVVGDGGSYSCKMGFAGEDFPRAYLTSLIGRTVDLEATRRLEAEMGAAVDSARSPAKAGGERGGATARRMWHPPPPPTGSPSGEARGPQFRRPCRGAQGNQKGAPRTERRRTGGTGGRFIDGTGYLMGGGADMDVLPLMEDGFVTDWDLIEKVWEHAERTRLKTKLSDHQVLISEKPFNSSKERMMYTEMMFEEFGVPAEFVSKDGVLPCFSIGRTTASLVDVGGDSAVATPVFDGWVESKGIVKSVLGRNALQRYHLNLLEEARGGDPIPPLPTTMMKTIADRTPPHGRSEGLAGADGADLGSAFEADTPSSPPYPPCPSGCRTSLRYRHGQVQGAGTAGEHVAADGGSVSRKREQSGPFPRDEDTGGVHRPTGLRNAPASEPATVVESVLACEREQQAQLFSSVVLAGGGCCFAGLAERGWRPR